MARLTIREPSPTVQQVGGCDPDGRSILSVLAKRTYRIGRDGTCVAAAEQLPLVTDVAMDPENPELLAHDLDIYPYKLATDVVLVGHAYSRPPRASFEVSLRMGHVVKPILVFGARTASLGPNGKPRFSEPEPVERVPLRYDRAYGGHDAVADRRRGNPLARLAAPMELAGDEARLVSPHVYPRNPWGKGYVIDAVPEALDGLALPNLEDPKDLLGPNRLAVGAPGRWPAMPLPQTYGWLSPAAFPRFAFLGLPPSSEDLEAPIAEVSRGYAPADVLKPTPYQDKFSFRFASGASLGLALPYLDGDEEVVLTGVHPDRPVLSFRLPSERPEISTDGRNGKLTATKPVLHTVLLEPDEDRVSLVWRGSAAALRPYLAEELARMPLSVTW